jgi:hypothetical protein
MPHVSELQTNMTDSTEAPQLDEKPDSDDNTPIHLHAQSFPRPKHPSRSHTMKDVTAYWVICLSLVLSQI